MKSSLPARRESVVFGATTITSFPLPDRCTLASVSPPSTAPSADDLQFVIVLGGAVQVADDLDPAVLPAGAALVSTGVATPDVSAIGGATLALVSTPAGQLTAAADTDMALVIPADQPLLSLTSTLVKHALTITDDLNWMSRHIIENMLTDALSHLVADATRHHHSRRSPDPFIAAITKITASSADPDLTAEAVARHANISLRQLERAFRKRGTTVTREIRRARIDHALALLNDRTRPSLTINEIARSVGFSNNSSLARAMSAEGRNPPQSARQQVAVGHADARGVA